MDRRGGSNRGERRAGRSQSKAIAAQIVREHPVNEGMQAYVVRSRAGRLGAASADARISRGRDAAGVPGAARGLRESCRTAGGARSADRERDLAIRISLGAGRGRMTRRLPAELLSISFAGGAAGCGVAVILLRMLSQWRARLDFPVQST